MTPRRLSILAVVLALAADAPSALTLVDPGLVVTTFSPAPTVNVAIPGPDAPAYTSFLYSLSRSEAPRIDELAELDAAGGELERGGVALDGAVLQMGRGAFAGRLFASEFGLPALVPDGVYEIGADRSVTLFANLGGGNPDSHGIAFGTGGAFGSGIFVANPTAGAADAAANRAIARLADDGSVAGTLAFDTNGPFYLAFPTTAAYGDFLYYTTLSGSAVMRVDSAGQVEPFAPLGDGETAIDLAFGVGGAFGDALYATVNHPDDVARRRIVRILPDGTVETVGTGLRGFRFDLDPTSGDLFLADEAGGILRISAIPEPGTAAILGAGIALLASGARHRATRRR